MSEFDGDLEDYQNYLANLSCKAEKKGECGLTSHGNKKVARQEAAEHRQSFAPLTKKIRLLESEIDNTSAILRSIELKLANPSIYEPAEKDRLKKLISDQALIKSNLIDLESEWLDTQEILESKKRLRN